MSKEFLGVVTRKGQITIPVEVRRTLGLNEGDTVAIVLENGQACLTRSESAVVRTAGLLKSERTPLSAQDLRQAAEEAIAQETQERNGE